MPENHGEKQYKYKLACLNQKMYPSFVFRRPRFY